MKSMNDALRLLAHCPYCSEAYQQNDAEELKRTSVGTMFYLRCTACCTAMMLSVRHREGGMTCSGVMTDCSLEDAKRFLGAAPISVDDVLGAHEALKLDKFMQIR